MTDITERNAAEAEKNPPGATAAPVPKNGRPWEPWPAGVAHEFNNILAAVMGHAELAQLKGQPDVDGDLDNIINAAQRAKKAGAADIGL